MDEKSIQAFWDEHPCGEADLPGDVVFKSDPGGFFASYDRHKRHSEPHIEACLDALQVGGKQLLEIGIGQGYEAECLVHRGASWTGVDLTHEAARRVAVRIGVHALPANPPVVGSAVALPFADRSFDIVFSHGVLHHIPDIPDAQREIARVLRPGGRLVMMVYARRSLNYQVSIRILRRLGLAWLYLSGWPARGKAAIHVRNARAVGLLAYLRLSNFIHRNTDGPLNPYAKVYDRDEVERDFPDFEIVRMYQRHMHAPPLRVRWLPLETWLGWHLWVELRVRGRRDGVA